jgi:hypothetical protein
MSDGKAFDLSRHSVDSTSPTEWEWRSPSPLSRSPSWSPWPMGVGRQHILMQEGRSSWYSHPAGRLCLKEDAMATQPDFFLYDRIGRLAAVVEVRNRRSTRL